MATANAGAWVADALTPELMLPSEALSAQFDQPVDTNADEQAQAAARAIAAVDRQGFKIGNVCFAVSHEHASELVELPSLCRLPNGPRALRGLANLHGNVVPVFSLSDALGGEASASKPMVLVFGRGDMAAGMIIAERPQRMRFTVERQAPAPVAPSAISAYVTAAYVHDGALWYELEYARLFDDLCA